MHIQLKTLLIFGLLIALSTQEEALDSSGPGMPPNPASDSTNPTTSTAAAISSTTSAAPTSTGTFTTGTRSNSTDNTPANTTAAATTTTTQGPEETSNGTFTTGTTSNSTNDTSAITTAATTITTPGPCASSPCVGDSTCEERFGGLFACICRSGLVYLETGCTQTKVFPGRLSLNKAFVPAMSDRASKQFKDTADEIENALRDILQNDNGYLNSTVLSLSSGSIVADVQNFYDLKSDVTAEEVKNLIIQGYKEKIEFIRVSPCNLGMCDSSTTFCKEEGLGTVKCTCKEGYIRNQFTSHLCISCLNGEKAVNDKCEKCSFGFSGFNCNDPYLLVVIVVSTVLGALLIIFILALIVVSCRDQKESSSPKVDFSSNYGNTELHKPTGVPRIPRANPDASWKSDNLEMTNSASNQALVTRDRPESKAHHSDYEDVSYGGQVPSAYSGYGGRGGENGVQNPYFRQDDDRTRRY
ncbi:mucin-13b [Siphateles boraxobius]|uniref:mucin-13b n=1 Tax=Siphateles boraxobius TaxID=180520 RepID=UPI0040629BCA